MDKFELADILKKMYKDAKEGGSVVNIHLFGIRFVNEIKEFSSASEVVNLVGLKKSYSTEVSKGMKLANIFHPNEKEFEAIFNFPKQYQSILKPYLLYFEEFLNDLCIETDVSIKTIGLDTILSVEPKNKDEALEKIADALKAYLCAPIVAESVNIEQSLQMQTRLTKLYAQCKNLESKMMYKELSLKELGQKIELKDTIINESKRVLVEAGIDTNIITQNNTMLLESLQSIKINNKEVKKKTFLNSIKAKINIPEIFSGSLEIKRDKL